MSDTEILRHARLKSTEVTHRAVRLAAAMTGETMQDLLERIALAELARVEAVRAQHIPDTTTAPPPREPFKAVQ